MLVFGRRQRRDTPQAQPAGVQKAQRHEVAGSWDTDLDEGQFDTSHSGDARQCHDRNEGRGHQPQRTPTQLSSKKTNGDHCQHMVNAAERMREAVCETMSVAHADMG